MTDKESHLASAKRLTSTEEVAHRLLPAFFVLAQNFFQREEVTINEFSSFLLHYSARAMELVLEPSTFSSNDIIDAARLIVEPTDSKYLALLSNGLDDNLMEVIRQEVTLQYSI